MQDFPLLQCHAAAHPPSSYAHSCLLWVTILPSPPCVPCHCWGLQLCSQPSAAGSCITLCYNTQALQAGEARTGLHRAFPGVGKLTSACALLTSNFLTNTNCKVGVGEDRAPPTSCWWYSHWKGSVTETPQCSLPMFIIVYVFFLCKQTNGALRLCTTHCSPPQLLLFRTLALSQDPARGAAVSVRTPPRSTHYLVERNAKIRGQEMPLSRSWDHCVTNRGAEGP